MSRENERNARSRRSFLNDGVTLAAGGLVAGTAGIAAAGSRAPSPDDAALPWPWAKIDPMEAGSRAYRYYLEAGG